MKDSGSKWIVITTIVTILSQIKIFGNFIRILMIACWVILFFLLLASNKKRIKISPFNRIFIVCYSMFIIFCLFCGLIGFSHFSNNYLHIMIIPLLISIIGNNLVVNKKKELVLSILKFYSLTAFIFAIYVNYTYFSSYSNWLAELQYVFDDKNSAGQIWSMAIIAIVFYIVKNEQKKFLWYGIALYLLIVLGLSQCRTAILALALIAILYTFKYAKYKIIFIIKAIIILVIAFNVPIIYNYLEHIFLLSIYKNATLNDFSSGRLFLYQLAVKEFIKNPIIGTGKWYVDCSYLDILTESGCIGFFIIEMIWSNRIIKNIKFMRSSINHSEKTFIFAITIFYLVTSLLEAYPPFGPGASSFCFHVVPEHSAFG